jgi:hypothetical protein
MSQFYVPFFNQFEMDLETLFYDNSDMLAKAKKAVPFIEERIKQLNKWLENHTFQTNEEEINFFKFLKPKLISKLIYYKTIVNAESEAPFGKALKRKHYQKVINKIYQDSKKNKVFYNYYRSGSYHNDEDYFLRKNHIPKLQDECLQMYYDTRLCTKLYYEAAKIISNDLLTDYFEKKIDLMDNIETVNQISIYSNLNWTGSKIDLVELVYALHQQKVFNGGNTDIKEIAASVSKMFNVDIEENIYRSYLDIKNRKSGHTKFLLSLSDSLNNKILSEEL